MSFGFGAGDLISVFSLSANIAKSLSKWDAHEIIAEQHQDIVLITTILQESTDLLSKADGPPPASAVAALERCRDFSEQILEDFKEHAHHWMSMQDKNVVRRKAHTWIHSSSERDLLRSKITKMKEMVMLFHDLVSQFYTHLQMERTIEMNHRLMQMQFRMDNTLHHMDKPIVGQAEASSEALPRAEGNIAEEDGRPSESSSSPIRSVQDQAQSQVDRDEKEEVNIRKPMIGNARFPRFLFRGSVFSTPPGSERGVWTGVQGAYDTQSEVNLVSERTVKRCRLEGLVTEIEPVTLQSREDQQWELKHQILLLWAPHNSTRTYDTVFLVDPGSLSDLLLGNNFRNLRHVMNNNRSFMTIKVAVSNQGEYLDSCKRKNTNLRQHHDEPRDSRWQSSLRTNRIVSNLEKQPRKPNEPQVELKIHR